LEENPVADLKPGASLPELQAYLAQICLERGWNKDTPEQKFMLFIEEVGELAKAMRGQANLYTETARPNNYALEEEFSDVLSYLLDLANVYHVDLESAFRAKEAVNAQRQWN
jgi:NTP pyrophosphatase (non-canonical NTP hydrolase)